MDFEATFDQMVALLSTEPGSVYKSFYYRKQTKNQWARDDPAFVFVQFIFVAVSKLTTFVCAYVAIPYNYIIFSIYIDCSLGICDCF